MRNSNVVPLDTILEVSYGNKLDLNKMTACYGAKSINFVSRTGKNNGVAASVIRLDSVKPYESGLITVAVGGSPLSSFVQTKHFYTAQNVAVLKPRQNVSLLEKLYYCLCIKKNAYRYTACGREANRTLRELLLPSRESIPLWVKESNIERYANAKESAIKNMTVEINSEKWGWMEIRDIFQIKKVKD